MEQELRRALSEIKTIAVVGAKDISSPVDRVGRYLLQAGFTLYPVHPKRSTVWGLTAYPTILDVPVAIDLVDVFRAPQFCAGHARECLQLSPLPKIFWMQLGITSSEAKEILQDSPVRVIEDRCLMIDHKRFFPGGKHE